MMWEVQSGVCAGWKLRLEVEREERKSRVNEAASW